MRYNRLFILIHILSLKALDAIALSSVATLSDGDATGFHDSSLNNITAAPVEGHSMHAVNASFSAAASAAIVDALKPALSNSSKGALPDGQKHHQKDQDTINFQLVSLPHTFVSLEDELEPSRHNSVVIDRTSLNAAAPNDPVQSGNTPDNVVPAQKFNDTNMPGNIDASIVASMSVIATVLLVIGATFTIFLLRRNRKASFAIAKGSSDLERSASIAQSKSAVGNAKRTLPTPISIPQKAALRSNKIESFLLTPAALSKPPDEIVYLQEYRVSSAQHTNSMISTASARSEATFGASNATASTCNRSSQASDCGFSSIILSGNSRAAMIVQQEQGLATHTNISYAR